VLYHLQYCAILYYIILYYYNRIQFNGKTFIIQDFNCLAFEANHKISRRHRINASSHDGSPSNAEFYLPRDTNENYVKAGKEPTALLQYFLHIYGPLLMRISIPNEIIPPTYSITYPKFDHPKYCKESREHNKEKDRHIED
jgi:hypothetical protein